MIALHVWHVHISFIPPTFAIMTHHYCASFTNMNFVGGHVKFAQGYVLQGIQPIRWQMDVGSLTVVRRLRGGLRSNLASAPKRDIVEIPPQFQRLP